MKGKWSWIYLLLVLILAISAAPVHADGIIIPPPPPCHEFDCPPLPRPMAQLDIRYHHVDVSIEEQLAVTRVDQVFYNPNDWPVEGTYVFPLPADAVVSSFNLWIDGKPVAGEVLNAEEARQIYEDTVRNLRDPALLEYEGRGALRASVFPIPPEGERRIQLEYTQALTAENGLVRYTYPLNTEKFSAQPLEDVRVRVEIRDSQAIRAVYSPSHAVGVDQRAEGHVIAGYEEKDVLPTQDFTLYYSLGESEAFHLFSYQDPSDSTDPDGFFVLLLAPKPGENRERVAKDVLLVLDRSGSMEGEKFQQAQAALRYILNHLNPEDRLYLQAFSTGLETYASGLRPTSEVNEALAWVDRLNSQGSTDINRALLEAAAVVDAERPTYLIFLTDGLPTEGEVNTAEILKNFARSAPDNLRLFPFGVGYDVDTVLLDTLSREHHGLSTYVRPGEALDETLSAFYERISTPVLTDLSLDFGGINIFDIYPNPLPDLFAGSQVVVVGRYRQGGTATVTLRGDVNGEPQTLTFPEQVFASDSRGEMGHLTMLPRLWATRKIGHLLNQVRLNGPNQEIIEQIVKLSVRYGIVTPYTSYLVDEPMPLGAEMQEKMAEDAYGQAQSAPTQASGAEAVERAAQEGAMQSADIAPLPSGNGSEDAGLQIRTVGPRTFIYKENGWLDTTYDPEEMETERVPFLSEAYFQLLSARPDLAPVLALGEAVTVVVEGTAYQITSEATSGKPVKIPAALATATAEPGAISASPTPGGTAAATLPVARAATEAPVGRPRASQPCLAGLLPLAAVGLAGGWLRILRKR